MNEAVYCSRCEAVIVVPAERVLEATRDHELDEHREVWGETVYTRLGASCER